MITNAAGAKAQDRGYRPFGGIAFETSYDLTLAPEAKGFIGERFDEDAGLQYLNARYYDPELGMFTQPDWFEVTKAGVGTNRYAYSGNDPVNGMDPGGNDWWSRPSLNTPNYDEANEDRRLSIQFHLNDPKVSLDDKIGLINDIYREEMDIELASDGRQWEALGLGMAAEAQQQLRDIISSSKAGQLPPGMVRVQPPREGEVGVNGIATARPVVTSGPPERYNRSKHYGNTPTRADRAALGATEGEVVDHSPPLVQRYYLGDPKTGEIPGYQMTPAQRAASAADQTRMSVHSQQDSNVQGGQMLWWSRRYWDGLSK